MMPYVLDANVVFSAIISGKPAYLDLARQHELILPSFALEELQFHQQVLHDKVSVNQTR